MTISDAVRRAAQRRTGREEELGEDAEAMAPGWSAVEQTRLKFWTGPVLLSVADVGRARLGECCSWRPDARRAVAQSPRPPPSPPDG
ncbi:hypothetical protein [Streptomyces sp. NRRL S-378]|uniref:hypothetical protein n=1 Tax=Streptomyces sp. NRRL S-378 TaxID=1463904 RepID=UPI00131AD193|nr:hypothetical protein [Streptomyces sp. NRRL S-378]